MAKDASQVVERVDHLCGRTTGSPAEVDALTARYIESDSLGLGAAEAQIVDHGVSVWALIAHLRAVGDDTVQAAADYGIDLDAVEAAVRFYCRHRDVIDARIALNRSYLAT